MLDLALEVDADLHQAGRFPEVALLTHPGTNVGYWNLHERCLAKDAHDRVLVNGEPVMLELPGTPSNCSTVL